MPPPNHPHSPDEPLSPDENLDDDDLVPLVPLSLPRMPNLGGRKKDTEGQEESSGALKSPTHVPTTVVIPLPLGSEVSAAPEADESSPKNRRPSEPWPSSRGKAYQPPSSGFLPLDDAPQPAPEPMEPLSPDQDSTAEPLATTPDTTGDPQIPSLDDTADDASTASGKEEFGLPDIVPPGEAGAPKLMATDKTWLTILLVGLLVVGGVFYFLLRGGLPTKNVFQATSTPSLPIKGEKITVEGIELRWKDTGSNSRSGSPNASTILPEAILTFAPHSDGAVRLFFKNERDRQVGDTANFEVRGGKTGNGNQNSVTCTEGLRSPLDYDDLRARGNARWTMEIWEGTDQFGPISGFNLLARVYLPWNLGSSSSKP